MKYEITKLAIEKGIYEEEGTIEVIASVKGLIESFVEKGYLVPIKEDNQ